LALTLGFAVMVTAVVPIVTRSNSSTVYTKPTPELHALQKYLTVSSHFYCEKCSKYILQFLKRVVL
jgi:hypothetical protein